MDGNGAASPPLSRAEAKGEAIIFAATTAFMEFGFAGTSMDVVAARARVSKTTLYARYASKEALFEAAISCGVESHGFHSSPDHYLDLPFEEGLRQIGTRLLDLLASEPAQRLEQLMVSESARFPELAASYFRAGPERIAKMVQAFLESGMERGLLRRTDSRVLSEIFLWAFRGLAHCESRFSLGPPPAPEEREGLVRQVVDLFLNGAKAA
jgi:TetR/AcrR family transcriptional repressor of mexJK operon